MFVTTWIFLHRRHMQPPFMGKRVGAHVGRVTITVAVEPLVEHVGDAHKTL